MCSLGSWLWMERGTFCSIRLAASLRCIFMHGCTRSHSCSCIALQLSQQLLTDSANEVTAAIARMPSTSTSEG